MPVYEAIDLLKEAAILAFVVVPVAFLLGLGVGGLIILFHKRQKTSNPPRRR